MDFLLKSAYLPDKFFMENGVRIDLREKIFREVVANLLIHREYTNAHIASIIIYSDRVELLNANKPYYHGKIDIKNFYPYPKNPLISKFFMQRGRVEEIGSGILNVTKYLKHYYPEAEAEFIDGDIFKAIIPIPVREKKILETKFGIKFGIKGKKLERIESILRTLYSGSNISVVELADIFGVTTRVIEKDIKFLKDIGLIEFQGPRKTGRYVLMDEGKKLFNGEF